MRPARVPAELCAGPFTTAQARAAGLTHSALRSSEWRQVLRGVWVHSGVEETREVRFAAVKLVLPPRAVAWAYGGLAVRRGCTPRGRSRRPCVVPTRRSGASSKGIGRLPRDVGAQGRPHVERSHGHYAGPDGLRLLAVPAW